ncbi:GNAT family protein [Paenibacillus sp. M1]|uniref:GNAT family protein n=1 Tax=Paenibacillus haidiansis TaxID=1574488 RepID=A0ABU7VQ15_9BACL
MPTGLMKRPIRSIIWKGLNPSLTGKGKGVDFLASCIQFVQENYQTSNLQLVVAEFNKRAIKVYERVGFVSKQSFKSKVGDEEMDFIVMQRQRGI